jgi:hypothetical protein
MNEIKIESDSGSSVTIDADSIASVEVSSGKRWWLFGPLQHSVIIGMRGRPLETVVVKCYSIEGPKRVQEKIELAILS